MPKVKTRKAVKKRFRLTANGHVKYKKPFKSHIATKKTTKRKRKLRRTGIVHSGFEPQIRSMIIAAS